jgi:fructan beta-fructosidase
MSHLSYEDMIPTHGWKGMLSAPREINIAREADGSYRLVQTLHQSWNALRASGYEFAKSSLTNEVEWDLPLSDAMEFDLKIDSHKGCTLEFDFGSKTKILLTWDVVHHLLSIDRTSKNLAFHPSYSSIDSANLSSAHVLSIHIILDKYSIEILADGGKVCLSSVFFSPNPLQRFRILGKLFSASGKVWALKNKHRS